MVKINTQMMIDRIIYGLDKLINEKKAIIELGTLPPSIYGDKTQLTQVFQNLITNALKFHAPNQIPKIIITSADKEQFWEFSIRDNGIGIEPAFFDKIFLLFKKLHPKSEYEGTGIGLALCKKVVERHGGDIQVTSTLGKGTTFTFCIAK